jgi:PKD repeat protein
LNLMRHLYQAAHLPTPIAGTDDGSGTSTQGPTVSHTYQAAATYTVTLTVTDVVGAATLSTVAVIVTSSPVATTCSSTPATIVGTDGDDNLIGTQSRYYCRSWRQ